MQGVVFLTTDHSLSWRSRQVLEENPSFARDNYDLILRLWNFDTDDTDSMRNIFIAFRDLKLSQREVLDFAKSVDFDISKLRQ